jgi:hypothetical protein
LTEQVLPHFSLPTRAFYELMFDRNIKSNNWTEFDDEIEENRRMLCPHRQRDEFEGVWCLFSIARHPVELYRY